MLVLKPGASRLGEVDELAFAPDGRMLAAPAGGYGVMLWHSFTNGAKGELLPAQVRAVARLAFTPDGAFLIAGNDELSAVRLTTGTCKRFDIPTWATLAFAISPDSSRVIVGERPRGGGARFTRWPLPNPNKPVWEVTSGTTIPSRPMFVSHDQFVVCEWGTRGGCLVTRSVAAGET